MRNSAIVDACFSAIFTDHVTAQRIASIATNATDGAAQIITYSDYSYELTDTGTTLALNGTAISAVGTIL